MLSHLEVHAPSSTTISYVVSSRHSSTSKVLTFLKHLLRVVIVWHAILLVLIKVSQTGATAGYDKYVEILLSATVLQAPLLSLSNLCQPWVAGLCSTLVIGLCLRRDYTGALHVKGSMLVLMPSKRNHFSCYKAWAFRLQRLQRTTS